MLLRGTGSLSLRRSIDCQILTFASGRKLWVLDVVKCPLANLRGRRLR
jgi:hypothetical protein